MAAEQRLTPADRANLVAYLDGELNEAESQVLATKLTQSATARREVDSLERTWALLDYLPRPQASEQLTARTLSEVKLLSLQGDQREEAARTAAQRFISAAAWVVASFMTFTIGYVITAWIWPDPTTRLVRDLPIAEQLDEYRDVDNWEFLDALARSPEFAADHN